MHTVATALRAICKYFDGVSGYDSNPHLYFHYESKFLYLCAFLLQRFSYYILKKESNAIRGEERVFVFDEYKYKCCQI
jgi:hypothetical protein